MPEFFGTKWGDPTFGTTGGTVTWSIAPEGELISQFFTGLARFDKNGNLKRSSSDDFLKFDYQQVIEDAFAEWAKHANINFQQVPHGAGSGDGDIRIYFGPLPGNILGLGAFPSSVPLGGDILFDVRNGFNSNKALFRGLVLHEIGHALGLDHTSGVSIMTPVLKYTSLQRDDRDGIRVIYGDPLVPPTLEINGAGLFQMKAKNDDLITVGNDLKNKIVGTDGDDSVEGGGNDDKLISKAGDDDLNGGAGNDLLRGGTGADVLNGGDDFDTADYRNSGQGIVLDLEAPNGTGGDAAGDVLTNIERILGSRRDDDIRGDSANNEILGYSGADTIHGRDGDDTLNGSGGNDSISGGDGNDLILGGGGNDLLEGDGNNDTLLGSRGNDTLDGGAGDDELNGGSGRDVLIGGLGSDILIGGRSADQFVFTDGHGTDTIRDFNRKSAAEFINLSGLSTLSDWDDVQAAATDTANGLLIDTGGGNSILLNNIRLEQLGADDFLF